MEPSPTLCFHTISHVFLQGDVHLLCIELLHLPECPRTSPSVSTVSTEFFLLQTTPSNPYLPLLMPTHRTAGKILMSVATHGMLMIPNHSLPVPCP